MWIKPTVAELEKEFHVEHELKGHNFWNDWDEFLEEAKNGRTREITPQLDKSISYRSRTDSYESLLNLIKSYRSYPEFRNEDTLKNLYDRVKEGKDLYMPIIIDFEKRGYWRVFSGNTRMDVAFQCDVNPVALIVKSYK
jgi:hypothetical protein